MKLKVKAFLALIFFIPAVVSADHNWPSDEKASIDVKENAFCQVLASYTKQINDALDSKNDIRVDRVRKKQRTDIQALMPNKKFQDWIIRVKRIKVDNLMNATLEAELPCHKKIVGQKIPETNEMTYGQLADVGKGDFVLVTGTLDLDYKGLQPQEFKATFISIVGLN